MRKPAKRNVSVATSSANDKPVKPVAKPRNVNTGAKQAAPVDTAHAAAAIIAPVTAAPVADMPRGLARDAAGVVRYATNFNQYSDRDTAYLVFYGTVARAANGVATLRAIHAAGADRGHPESRKRFNPNYTGSAKATDVGAINRLCKAGYFERSADGNAITATDKAKQSKAYLGTL